MWQTAGCQSACKGEGQLFNPEMSALIQQRPIYSENLNSETPGDSKNAVQHWVYGYNTCDVDCSEHW